MKSALAILRGLVLLSCGCTATPPSETPPPAVTAAPAATPSAAPAQASTTAPMVVPSERDPAVMKLATAALQCPYDQEEGDFDDDCPAFQAWWQGGLSDPDAVRRATLLSMLEDPDVRVRVLAARPGLQDTGDYFNEPIRARRLMAVAKTETNGWVQHEVSHQVARIDAEKLGLTAELRELAKNPDLRVGLASAISYHTTPVVLELTRAFLQDESEHVRKAVALALGGRGPDDPPYPDTVCKLIHDQLTRTDDRVGDLFFSAATSRCAGGHEILIAELTKRVADPSKVTKTLGTGYVLGASLTCERTTSDELKKKGYGILLALTGTKVPDSMLRQQAIGSLASCDKVAAAKVLAALAKDKDKAVADEAKRALEELKKAQ